MDFSLPVLARRVLITGADGFLGRTVVSALARLPDIDSVVALDVREVPAVRRVPGVVYAVGDVRAPDVREVMAQHRIDAVVHLASIVTPGAGSTREFEYSVDVLGTKNVLEACVATGVHHIVVSSSGAAYGYHVDNPAWIDESQALRGNEAFAYSHHKRLVEEMLADFRTKHPALRQTVLRIGTILGEHVNNQITALFDKPRILAIRGSDSPFVFIWDEDVTGCIVHAITSGRAGCFNVAGDGALTLPQIAALLRKPMLSIPAPVLRLALKVGSRLRVSRYGPEQLDFLRYRPVLSNYRLKTEFGYVPRKSSLEAFLAFKAARKAHSLRMGQIAS
ncbi:SDR family oxidoreductase [Variovorax sp. J22R133]|uniref:SDR family oxidoreductase n=1 Tax=Variovorax brevis TaxID=3053503 RepID=UPI002574AF1D|nr:SDR family oxidoreductase [Variovorax sp. J22R133]MDM0114557.1 SDR family oxidoreductase [Variovorax sp. J22R133]